jgi:hypothetical protein
VRVIGEHAPVVLQGVGQVFHPPGTLRAPAAADLRTRVVVICEGVDPDAIERTLAVLSPVATTSIDLK